MSKNSEQTYLITIIIVLVIIRINDTKNHKGTISFTIHYKKYYHLHLCIYLHVNHSLKSSLYHVSVQVLSDLVSELANPDHRDC